MATLSFDGIIGGPHELLAAASPQNLTAAWADLGAELSVWGASSIALWVNLDINNSVNARVRLLAKHTSAGTDEYVLPIRTVGASAVLVEDEYIEFNVDADQKMALSWDLNGLVPYVQFQVMAEVAGTTPGQIDSAFVTTALRSV